MFKAFFFFKLPNEGGVTVSGMSLDSGWKFASFLQYLKTFKALETLLMDFLALSICWKKCF